jgi:hypothetical protein
MRALLLALFASLLALAPGSAQANPDRYDRSWDKEYTDEIRKHTTSPEFLTEFVDHLPKSARVPSPKDHLGYIAGAEGKLTYAKDIHAYFKALANKSPNVRVESMGKTAEGREQLLVYIADAGTLRRLDKYKDITRKLSDPRKIDDKQAERLIKQGKPFYWLIAGMHSPETGNPEMLMELAYRLAVDKSAEMRRIRKNVIVVMTPVLEVDGRERMVDLVRWWEHNPGQGIPPLLYWGHYVAHDNNRDSLSFALPMTQNLLKAFLDMRPQILLDLHESIPFLYVSAGTGPYNAWLDPLAIETWTAMAHHEVRELTRRGVPGVWTHGFYTGWAPSYMFYIAHAHNAIGRFYETFGNSTPDTRTRRVKGSSEREWYRGNPPYPVVEWSLRNNVNYSQSGVLAGLQRVARIGDDFLRTYYELGKRAVAKAKSEGPAAYVIPAGQKRPGQVRDMLNLLIDQAVEVHYTTAKAQVTDDWPPKPKRPGEKDEEAKDEKDAKKKAKKDDEPRKIEIPAGSYVIRMDQPYSRLADMVLDVQYYRPDDNRAYDDTGWTFGYSKNIEVHRVVNPEVLEVPMEQTVGHLQSHPGTTDGKTWLIPANADTDVLQFLWKLNQPVKVADQSFKVSGSEMPAGTIIIEEPSDAVKDAAQGLSIGFRGVNTSPSVATHEVKLPRIAVLHTWVNTQDEGWFRLALESLGIPYDYISTDLVARTPDLGSKYDTILFPPCNCSTEQVINGLPDGPPMAWKKTDVTPNLGVVDSTEDIRQGLGYEGLANLAKFVKEGGTLITAADTARFAAQVGLAPNVGVVRGGKAKARGTLLRADVRDPGSPIAYGYDDEVPIYVGTPTAFRIGRFDRPKEDKRPSGRGDKKDPDVPQARPYVGRPDAVDRPLHEQWLLPEDGEVSARLEFVLPQVKDRPRAVLVYSKNPGKMLLSGLLSGAGELAGKPALVDAPNGKGHVILFGFNPMWRQQTQGMFSLVLSAALHGAGLSANWPPKNASK